MTTEPRFRFTVDVGTATVAAALLAELDGRWRLLAAGAMPLAVGVEPLLADLLGEVRSADTALARALPPTGRAAAIQRHEAQCRPLPGVAILAASDRRRDALASVARASGLRFRGVPHGEAAVAIGAALRPDVSVVLAGTGRSPTADERGRTDELIAMLSSIVARRPDVMIVLSGSLGRGTAAAGIEGRVTAAPAAGEAPADDIALRNTLLDLTLPADATRRGIAMAGRELALLLERRVEIVEVGHEAGLRVVAWPAGEGATETGARFAIVEDGALVPAEPDDDVVDGIAAWSTVALDRVRLRDRLAELRSLPWGEADGEGALLRLAAARAAVARIAAAAPDLEALTAPDLVVGAGGAWGAAPPPAVALALVDVVRHPGVVQLALDHARLLGPLGLVADPGERRALLAGAADDLLMPLGTAITPGGVRASRGTAGRLLLHRPGTPDVEVTLEPGALQLVDLPPGASGVAKLALRDPVDLGVRARQFAVPVSGGLGGLLVDLRDVPLRLPSRLDRRRDMLAAWQRLLWPEAER